MLWGNERPWIILQRPILGGKCSLFLREKDEEKDFEPLAVPFNVHPRYLGPEFLAGIGDSLVRVFFILVLIMFHFLTPLLSQSKQISS